MNESFEALSSKQSIRNQKRPKKTKRLSQGITMPASGEDVLGDDLPVGSWASMIRTDSRVKMKPLYSVLLIP